MTKRILALGAAVAGAGLGWGLFESQWVRLRHVDVELDDLDSHLDGLRILHLSDLHLGAPSLSGRSLAKAVAWGERVEPDVVVLTGDLLSRQRGEFQLRNALDRLNPRFGTYVILGNHDADISRDPFSAGTVLDDLGAHGAMLLEDSAHQFTVNGAEVVVAGCAPGSRAKPPPSAEAGRAFRILLAHFPDTIDLGASGAYDLVLAGHMHAGQICLPSPRGKIHLLNPNIPYQEGMFRVRDSVLHVSPGLGTSFVPIRFMARPEATVLRLKARPR